MQSLINKIKEIVVTPCLEEEESYAIRSRKLAFIAVAAIVSNGLVVGIPATILSGMFDPTVGAYIVGALFVQISFTTAILPYVYLRRTRRLPEWLVDVQIWTLFPVVLAACLFVHQGSIPIVSTVVTLLGVLLRARGWQLLVLLGISGNILHALINDYGDVLPELHETFYTKQILSIRLMYLFGSNASPLLFFGGGLHVIMMEFVQRSEQADAAIAMNLAVADKLRRYDTDGVAEILAANKGKVDENLLEAFSAIQHNLQEYRPHIPDYVIASSLSTGDGGSGVDEDDEGELQTFGLDDEGVLKLSTTSLGIYSASNNNNNNKSRHDDDDDDVNSDYNIEDVEDVTNVPVANNKSRLSTNGSPTATTNNRPQSCPTEEALSASVTSGNHETNTATTSDSFNNNNNNNNTTGSSRRKSNSGMAEVPPKHARKRTSNSKGSGSMGNQLIENSKSRQHFYGRATTVFVRFVSTTCGSDGSGNGFVSKGSAVSAMNILSKCVDAGSKLAKAHGGALQYMQGCGLMVSFNAASRVHAHESKACVFALGLKAILDGEPIVMHASIVTTNVLSFFAGNSGQLMLTVLGGFMPQHTAMHHYLSQTVGKEASCVLLSDTVVPTIEMLYEHRLLGGVQLKENIISSEYSPLSELLHGRVVVDDEWLYQLAHRTDNTDIIAVRNKVVLAALHGTYDYEDVPGISISQDEPDTVFQKCVTERIADCRQNGNTFYSSMVPPVMW